MQGLVGLQVSLKATGSRFSERPHVKGRRGEREKERRERGRGREGKREGGREGGRADVFL